jgi:hypothetical protein
MVADIGVHEIGEIERGGVARQREDRALRREQIDLIREQVDLDVLDEFDRRTRIAFLVDEAGQPLARS